MGWNLSWTAMLMLAAGGLLLLSGIEDARVRTIHNGKNAALALLAPAWWWANGLHPWPDMAIQAALALALAVPFLAAFAFGLMGGGDVKMLAALALWLPPGTLVQMLIVMSLIGGGITLILMLEARIRARAVPEIPYGVAIAAAGIALLPGTVS